MYISIKMKETLLYIHIYMYLHVIAYTCSQASCIGRYLRYVRLYARGQRM